MKAKKIGFNWVDLVILILIVSLAGVVLFRDAIFGKTVVSSSGVGGQQQLLVTTKALEMPLEVCEAFEVGQKLVANDQYLPGEVVAVEYQPTSVYELKDGKVTLKTEPNMYDLYVTVKVNANKYNSFMEIGGQELKVGVIYYTKTDRAEANGYIVSLEKID